MYNIKIIHTADIHLGAEQSSIGEKSRQRKEEILMTFDRIISVCKNENIALLLIAGDLFESNNLDNSLYNTVKKAFREIPRTTVAIAPGNHDHISISSPYIDKDWSENVFIFTSPHIQSFEFKEKGFRVFGSAFNDPYLTEAILGAVNPPEDELLNICVLHGDLISQSQQSSYGPVTSAQIGSSGMDYVALGHIHKRTGILKSGRTYYSYCGCPEGQGFDELGEKGVYKGSISKGGCKLEFLPLCSRMNIELNVDISGASSCNEVVEIILSTVKNKYGDGFNKHLYKIIMEGEIAPDFNIDCVAVAARLENQVFYIKVKDLTRIAVDIDSLSHETTLKGIFARKMLEKIASAVKSGGSDEEKHYRTAMYLGLKAFDSEVKYNEN